MRLITYKTGHLLVQPVLLISTSIMQSHYIRGMPAGKACVADAVVTSAYFPCVLMSNVPFAKIACPAN